MNEAEAMEKAMAEIAPNEDLGWPRCDNCGAEIPWQPTIHRGHIYCCGGCAQGGPCYCSYDLATLDWRPLAGRLGHVHRSAPARMASDDRRS